MNTTMSDLSNDKREFARLCVIEMTKAAQLGGGKLPPPETQYMVAEDMARNLNIHSSRVPELWSVARAHYAAMPRLLDLQRALDNHMRPITTAPAPKDAPKIEVELLCNVETRMRHLAAVRTSRAIGVAIAGFGAVEPEPWMEPLLLEPPQIDEVRAAMRACTESLVNWYIANPHVKPHWGHYIKEYRLVE